MGSIQVAPETSMACVVRKTSNAANGIRESASSAGHHHGARQICPITLQAAAEAPGSLSSETSTPGGMLLVVPPMHMTMDPGPRISSASVNASTPVSGRFSWRCTMASGGKAANPIVSIVEDRMISAIISLPSSLSPLSPPLPPSPPPILSASSLLFLIVL